MEQIVEEEREQKYENDKHAFLKKQREATQL